MAIKATRRAWKYAEKIASDFGTTAFVIMKQCEKVAKADHMHYKAESMSLVTVGHVKMWENAHERNNQG